VLPSSVYLTVASALVVLQLTLALLHEKHALVGAHVGASGTVVSTTTTLLGHVTAFLFVALSATLFAGNVNVTSPFLFANAVYVNVYFFPFVTLLTTASLKLTYALLNVIAHPVKEFVAIHANVSVHVNSIVHVAHAFNGVLLGSHQLQLGAVLSNLIALLVTLIVLQFHTLSQIFGLLIVHLLDVHSVLIVHHVLAFPFIHDHVSTYVNVLV
jgi:hypothetical protein